MRSFIVVLGHAMVVLAHPASYLAIYLSAPSLELWSLSVLVVPPFIAMALRPRNPWLAHAVGVIAMIVTLPLVGLAIDLWPKPEGVMQCISAFMVLTCVAVVGAVPYTSASTFVLGLLVWTRREMRARAFAALKAERRRCRSFGAGPYRTSAATARSSARARGRPLRPGAT
jgi:hypothetical protein